MIRSRKSQFVLAIISVCIFSHVLIAESNKVKINPKFETNNKKSQLWISHASQIRGRGPIKPSHVAVFHIRQPHYNILNKNDEILQILQNTAGQNLSQQQQKFLNASDSIAWLGIQDIKNHNTVYLYAVSQEDAKKMAQAYLEIPTKHANENIQRNEKYLKDAEERIIEIKKALPEKQKQADQIEPKYMEIKNTRYFSLSNNEAHEKAKETMLEMEKKLDVLEIELAGIKEKIQSIEKFRSIKSLDGHDFSEDTLNKLEQMLVEQLIELKSAEAREQAAIKIRNRDKDFIDLLFQWKNLSSEVLSLKGDLEDSENRVREMEESLPNPEWYLLPPEIYQNKVTIYPVLIEQS